MHSKVKDLGQMHVQHTYVLLSSPGTVLFHPADCIVNAQQSRPAMVHSRSSYVLNCAAWSWWSSRRQRIGEGRDACRLGKFFDWCAPLRMMYAWYFDGICCGRYLFRVWFDLLQWTLAFLLKSYDGCLLPARVQQPERVRCYSAWAKTRASLHVLELLPPL